jgi:hypothetical protein
VKPAFEVADIFRHHGASYRAAHAASLCRRQRRVMAAIEACRTAVLGGHVEQCTDCGETRLAYNSCRDRHCPKCQGLARAQWLADRQSELLPVPYQACLEPEGLGAGDRKAIRHWQSPSGASANFSNVHLDRMPIFRI